MSIIEISSSITASFLAASVPYKTRRKGQKSRGGGTARGMIRRKPTVDIRVIILDEIVPYEPGCQSGLAHFYPQKTPE
jgi:hypothetical protein